MPPPLYAPRAAVQLQPIHALRLACGAQRALLPVTVGAMNIHDVRDRRLTSHRRQTSDRQTDRRQTKASLNAPAYQVRGGGIISPHSTEFLSYVSMQCTQILQIRGRDIVMANASVRPFIGPILIMSILCLNERTYRHTFSTIW